MVDEPFRVGFTSDCLDADGAPGFDPAALEPLKAAPGVTYEFIAERTPAVTPGQAAAYDAIVVKDGAVERASLARPDRRLALVARFGVGYDKVDVAACTAAGVALTIAPDGVRRPVATAILLFILALSHKLMERDRATRAGDWDSRLRVTGMGLTGKTVGSIGVGNIGREAFRLLQPLEMRHLAHDPAARPEDMRAIGVRLADKDTVLRESDFVTINCPLTPLTRGLVGAREIALMKPTAYLINTARGPIVDEKALYAALRDRRIAGAGLDVFEAEPTPKDNPILKLDNVIVTPHSLCWSDEFYRRTADSAIAGALALARGELPAHMVDAKAAEHPAFKALLAKRRALDLP